MRVAFGMAVLVIFAALAAGQDQAALVTFYSSGCNRCGKRIAAAIAAGAVEAAYRGAIYDGDEQLVKSLTPNRFVTFRLNPGPHSFAGQNMNGLRKKRDDNKRDLLLTLQSGKHYYVRLSTRDKNVYIVHHLTNSLTLTECEEAMDEGHKTDPISPKGLDEQHLKQIVATPYFPVCESSGSSLGQRNLEKSIDPPEDDSDFDFDSSTAS